ncbi:MAG: acyltransferase [Steroidobacter sp.]
MKQEWIERPEAGTVLGYRLFLMFAQLCGRTASRLVLYPITLYFLIRRGPERRASRMYIERVTGKKASLWQVAKHIHCFAAVTLDRAFLLSERFRRFDIRTFGLDELRKAWGQQRGVLVFGSHLGSFDALRVLAEFRQDVKVRVVIDLEHNAALMQILNSFNPALAQSIINARQEGTTTALAIKEALDEKALVTMLVERARPGNAVAATDFLGHSAPFPTAPWQLAAVLKAPVILCFGLYRGGNRYDLHFELFAESLTIERRDREASLKDVIQRYADRLAHYARIAPYNWFNFYDFWQPNKSISTPPPHAAQNADGGRPDGDHSSRRDDARR